MKGFSIVLLRLPGPVLTSCMGKPTTLAFTDINATGLGGTWQDQTAVTASSDMFLYSGSLAFGDLATSGNSVRGDSHRSDDIFARSITADIDAGGELWFSFLINKLQNYNNAAEGGVIIGNQAINNAKTTDDNAGTGLVGFGIAPTTSGNNLQAYAWNGSAEFEGGSPLNVATNGSETNLMIGYIDFDGGTGGADVFTAYQYVLNAGSVGGGTLNQIGSSIEVDIDQSTLGILSVTRQVNTAYDEIRIGTSLNDVLGVPEPATMSLLALGGLGLVRRRKRA